MKPKDLYLLTAAASRAAESYSVQAGERASALDVACSLLDPCLLLPIPLDFYVLFSDFLGAISFPFPSGSGSGLVSVLFSCDHMDGWK
jgi:hypothetical protein